MPRPHTLIARKLASACEGCPLRRKESVPVPPTIARDPQALIVLDHPAARDHFHNRLLAGDIGQRVARELRGRGIERVSVICRIGCYPPAKKRTAATLKAACTSCTGQFERDISQIDDGKIPILAMGKWATSGLGTYEWSLTSGDTVRVQLAKLAYGVPVDRYLTLDSPAYALWGKPAMQVPWLAGINRFAGLIQGSRPSGAPPTLIHPNGDALAALRSMGPEIAYDVETLGVDPLTVPITCAGVSDGEKTVVLPWDRYSTATEGEIRGVAEGRTQLDRDLRDEYIRLLHSNRMMITANGSYDILGLAAHGIRARNDFDVHLAEKILYPEIPANLEAIARRNVPRLDHSWKTVFKAITKDQSDTEKGSSAYTSARAVDLRHYCGLDCWTTRMAKDAQAVELATED